MTKLVAALVEKSKDFDFKKQIKRTRSVRMKTRLQALYLLTTGMRMKNVAKVTLTAEVSIRRWARTFVAEGLDGLKEKAGRGRRRRLPKSSEAAFVADVERLSKERKGGRVIAKDVQVLLLEKYQVEYGLKAVYVLLARFDFSWVSCRSKHPKRSQEVIDSFKSSFSDIVSEIKKK